MRTFARIMFAVAAIVLLANAASAQTSVIAGTVKDASGAVLPGVTVEVASPALIEKVRTATTDGTGQYKITNLVTGTYTVTFTLPGFSTVKRENVELTSDFTATISADLKVGSLEETITVAAESPVVDVQSITTRTVMTREVLDAIPTGRNIQAVGIMIPGTAIAVGGGGALSRDVGGSGNLQQSPLQYRGSADTVQTIEGLRLNNLCAQGAYSGVYWNEGSFQEFSYVTGADSAEMGQGGMRVNMVPRDGSNSFHGVVVGNYSPSAWASDNCASSAVGQPCTRANLTGDTTFNKTNNYLSNVSALTKNYDFNPGFGGPIKQDRAWFYGTFRYLGVNKTVVDSFYDKDPSPFKYVADTTRPGIDDGHIRSFAGRVSAQLTAKDKISYYHDEQDKVRGHWGIASNVPPEASAIQATPTSFVSVTKWTRTQNNKLLFDGGLSVYDQEYQENYQPDVFAGPVPLVTITDSSTGKIAGAWNNPADHFSKLFTEMLSASYVTGAHSFKFGGAVTEGRWRLAQQYTGDVNPVTYNNGVPVSVTLRIPTDRRNAIKEDLGLFAQDKWTVSRATINAGVRYDQFIGATLPETLPAGTFNPTVSYSDCPDGQNNLNAGCTGRVQNWKDISPRLGVAFDVFGNGKTAIKASVARYVAGQQIATADANNAENTVGLTDTRAWTDRDGNGSPFDSAGHIQLNELAASTNPSFGKNVPSSTLTDPAVLSGWGVRGYNWEYTVSAQHEIAPRISVNGGWYRRKFGNQTVTVDNRYSFTKNSFDGPFCVNAPLDANLPNGGGYQVCGLYDLKPSVIAQNLPANSTITFSDNYGGETNIYEGFDLTTVARFKTGAFLSAGINAQKRIFDQCNLVSAGIVSTLTTAATEVAEIFPDGSKACHQDLPYRPDFKLLGSYTLPYDIQISGTYQFTRGVQNGGAAPSILATWATTPASATTIGQFRTPAVYSAGATTKSINLMAVGQNYGNDNLSQLDLRASKRFRFQGFRFRVDLDAYNLTNSDWPFTVNTTFSNAASSNYLKPTNVLQARFFKIGMNFDF
ncbi:MAG: carboxypeptidase-like regulatory domain-containing protein [Acidobacteriia bacterium]|nr:carboxypeptidase-like regulatory domain-containing protein [Terriglobia bacterium]